MMPPGIDWAELRSFTEITGHRISGWEGDLLIRLDSMRR